MIFHNLSKPVICTELSLLHSFEFCSPSALHTLELDIRASCLRILNYFFKQCFPKAYVCYDTTVNYSTLGTLVKLLLRSSVVCIHPRFRFTSMYSTQPIQFFVCFVFNFILSFSTYLNCHWNKCAF